MTSDLQYWVFRGHDLFANLNEKFLNSICDKALYTPYKKDELIYTHTERKNHVYILNQGRVKISHSLNNVEVVSEILKEGDIFGGLTLKNEDDINHEYAQAITETTYIYSIKISDFKFFLSENSTFATSYSTMLAEKLKIISGKYCDLAFKDVKSRVLNFFTLQARYEGIWNGDSAEIKMYCTHQDIADFTASTRQTVSSVIADLIRDRKIIYKGRSRLIIPDINQLRTNAD